MNRKNTDLCKWIKRKDVKPNVILFLVFERRDIFMIKKRNINHKIGLKIPWCCMALCAVSFISFSKTEIICAASPMHYQVTGTKDEEERRHVIDIDVSLMDEAVMPDYENISEFKISLMNTGTESLTNFEGSLEESGIYELYCEEDGVMYRLLSHEASQDQTEKTSDKTTILPDTLNPGDTVTIYAVHLPEDGTGTDKTEELFIVYTEETGRYEVPLAIPVQEENQEVDGIKSDQYTEEREEDSEIPVEEMTDLTPDKEEEKADVELKPDSESESDSESELNNELESNSEIKNVDQNNGTNAEGIDSEKDLKKKELENKSNEDAAFVDSTQEDFICEVKSIDRTKGSNIGNIFFAEKDSQYIVRFSPESTVNELNYQIGTIFGTVPVKGGFAVIEIPDNVSDYIEIFCTDQSQNKKVLCSGYVVNENAAPTVHYKKIEKDGKSYAIVTINDYGNVISGLSNCTVCMDGDFINESESSVLEKVSLFDEYEVESSRQYTILLENGKIHNFEVTARDYAGNSVKENFSFEMEDLETKDREIVNVVLPTSFNILVLPDAEENQLYGEDIVLCNKSDFPVQVDVTSAQVQIDHSIPDDTFPQMNPDIGDSALNKNFDLSLQLLQADRPVKSIKLSEGNTDNVASFVLSEQNSATDFEALQKSKISEVDSPDYAVLNIRGTIDQNTKNYWKNDDLHVKIVFQFNKLGEVN